MKVVTSAILMIAGACTALGIIHFRFWLMERARRDELAFSLTSFSVAMFACFELLMMHAETPEDFLFFARWSMALGSSMIISSAWFAYVNLHGRRWLFFACSGFRLLLVILNFIMPTGINYLEVKAIGHMTLLGEAVGYPIAVRNPWTVLAPVGHFLLIAFFLDTSIRAWRRGERRKALVFGTGAALFGLTIFAVSIFVVWGFIVAPVIVSFSFIFVVAAMVYELNYEMRSSAILSKKLIEREATLTETLKHLNLSSSAANVGMWTRKIGEDKMWISEKAGEIWGFGGERQFTRDEFFKNLHPEDRRRVITLIQELENGKNEFQIEYRIFTTDGDLRWVEARGKVEQIDESGIIRGAVVDITKRKLAEEAVHELSRRLMNAQEKERARLARELHDDLSQSLALLSIQLSVLNSGPDDVGYIKEQIQHLVSEIAQVAAQVRRISHELHPAKLKQLGLEAALNGLCREIDAAYPLKVNFEAENLPRKLPDDLSLCLYRVAQESLQNIIKHSAANTANITIKLEDHRLHLSISDNGKGFDVNSVNGKESLGLISIDERVRAVDGTFKITSTIGAGTKIEVSAPLKSNI